MKKYGSSIFLTGIILFPVTSYSQDTDSFLDSLTVVGGATYIIKSVDFVVGNKPFKPKFTSIDWSITTAYKDVYLKLNFDQSLRDHTQINNTLSGSGEFDNSLVTINREDSGLTFGYSVTNNISVFGGYKYGKTTAVTTGRLRTEPITNPPGSVTFVENSSLHFKEDGPFLGVNYTHAMEKSGAFGFSIAFAELDGEVVFNQVEPDPVTGEMTVFLEQVFPGDSSGLSYSLSWTDQLVESINYTITLKTTRYTFDAPPPADPSDDFDFDENFNILSVAFNKYF